MLYLNPTSTIEELLNERHSNKNIHLLFSIQSNIYPDLSIQLNVYFVPIQFSYNQAINYIFYDNNQAV